MKVAKDYVLKLGFVFKEILKAGPGVFFLSIGSMIITGVIEEGKSNKERITF